MKTTWSGINDMVTSVCCVVKILKIMHITLCEKCVWVEIELHDRGLKGGRKSQMWPF